MRVGAAVADADNFPRCTSIGPSDNECALIAFHNGSCAFKKIAVAVEEIIIEEKNESISAMEAIQNIAEFANAVASLVVGHRKILVEGGFDINISDQMSAALHASLLGLAHLWDFDSDNNSWIDDSEGEE